MAMKVLFATDGSNCSRHAELLAARIPSLAKGTWTAATVVSPPFVPMMGIEPIGAPIMSEDLQAIFDAQLESANRLLTETADRLEALGIACETRMLEGDAGAEINALAGELGSHVVVLGSRGLGSLEEFFLGSTAKHLLHKCAASILLGRRHGELSVDESIRRMNATPKLKLAIGTDGSAGSDSAIDAVVDSGTSSFESVALVAALPLSGIPAGIGVHNVAEAYRQEEAEAESMLLERAHRLQGIAEHVCTAHATAEPHVALTEYAREKDLDLIVVGSARQSLFDRIVVGSSAERIASEAPCSVWVVRPQHAS